MLLKGEEASYNSFTNILLIITSLAFIVVSIIYQSGNLSPDSIQYMLQARDFWSYKVNFPLGYPALIRTLSLFTNNDYFWASKLINIVSYFLIVGYCYKKRFFFEAFLFIFSFYPFILFYGTSLSEPVFFLILTILLAKIYELSENKKDKTLYLKLMLLFFALVSVRFTGIFFGIATIIYFYYLLYRKTLILKQFLCLSISVIVGIGLYLTVNKLYCGFFLGERAHLRIQAQDIITFLKERTNAFLTDFSFLKVFLHNRINNLHNSIHWAVGLMMILLFIFRLFKAKNTKTFSILLVVSGLVSLASLLYSYYTVKIDDNIRIKSLVFYFIMLLLFLNISEKILWYAKSTLILITSVNIVTYFIYSEPYFNSYKRLKTMSENINSEKLILFMKMELKEAILKFYFSKPYSSIKERVGQMM